MSPPGQMAEPQTSGGSGGPETLIRRAHQLLADCKVLQVDDLDATCADSLALSAPIVTVAWRYKDAAKEQARRGVISWKVYREYCAEVDRIKRARLRAAEDAARVPQLDAMKGRGLRSS